jgi:hypothetical protein
MLAFLSFRNAYGRTAIFVFQNVCFILSKMHLVEQQFYSFKTTGSVTFWTYTGFIRGILRGVRYAESLRVLFLHRRSPSWTTLVLYSRAVFFFNEPTNRWEQHAMNLLVCLFLESRYVYSPFTIKVSYWRR